MGCTQALWIMAKLPYFFDYVGFFGMGSAFESQRLAQERIGWESTESDL